MAIGVLRPSECGRPERKKGEGEAGARLGGRCVWWRKGLCCVCLVTCVSGRLVVSLIAPSDKLRMSDNALIRHLDVTDWELSEEFYTHLFKKNVAVVLPY